MDAAIVTFRLLAASQVLLFSSALLLSANSSRVRALGALLGVGVLAYLVIPLAHDRGMNLIPLALLSNSVPALVLLFTWAVFEESSWPSRSIATLCGGYALLVALTMFWRDADAHRWLLLALQLAKLCLAAYAIALLWRGREDDLVEARLRLRRYLLVSLLVSVTAVVIVELVSGWRVPKSIEAAGMAGIFLLCVVINLAFLRVNPGFALSAVDATKEPDATHEALTNRLFALMTEDRLYADHDLRISGLAERVGVPEYQLRRLINRQLGYTNFNQFVNGYRIDEAAKRLITQPHTPVLTLALDVGFRSMSSFNGAFRAHFACSPTQYRKRALKDS